MTPSSFSSQYCLMKFQLYLAPNCKASLEGIKLMACLSSLLYGQIFGCNIWVATNQLWSCVSFWTRMYNNTHVLEDGDVWKVSTLSFRIDWCHGAAFIPHTKHASASQRRSRLTALMALSFVYDSTTAECDRVSS